MCVCELVNLVSLSGDFAHGVWMLSSVSTFPHCTWTQKLRADSHHTSRLRLLSQEKLVAYSEPFIVAS